MIKIFFICVLTTTIFGAGCAGIADTGMDPKFDYSTIKTIGIYIYPSGKNSYDGQLSNLLSLHFISLGYKVVDLNPNLSDGKSDDSPSFMGFSNTVIHYYNSTERICDAIVVAKSKWKNEIVVTKENFYFNYGMKYNILNLEIAMFEATTALPIVSRNFKIDQQIIQDTRQGDLLLEPIRFLIQRSISAVFDKFPIASSDSMMSATRKIPLTIYVDRSYQDRYGKQWKIMIDRRILYANDILKRTLDIELTVDEYRPWLPFNNVNTGVALDELTRASNDLEDKFALGIFVNNDLQYNWRERNDIGAARYLGHRFVVCDLPSLRGLEQWDALEEAMTIVHETGHIFGAIHTSKKGSIMFPTSGTIGFKFDSLNHSIIKEFINTRKNRHQDSVFNKSVSTLQHVYESGRSKQIYLLQALFAILKSHHTKTHSSTDSANIDFSKYISNGTLISALNGYSNFSSERWKDAEKFFLSVIKSDTEFGEVYLYLTILYDKLKDLQKRNEYAKLTMKYWQNQEDEE